MLQVEKPDDYVLATGETHTVRSFVEKAFGVVGITVTWKGKGVNEVGIDQNGRVIVRVDPKYYRPTEVDLLLGNPAKARKDLGWERKVTFDELVKDMVDADVDAVEDKHLKW